jgi:ComF family protein
MRIVNRLIDAILALLYPARCSACDAPCDEGAAFCSLCLQSIEAISFACEACGLPLPRAHTGPTGPLRCIGCLSRPPPFESARAPFQFGGAVARAIRRLKWARAPELAKPLAKLLVGRFAPTGDVIVPVPLHPVRLREREFNQAALLALGARRSTGPPVDVHALERVRDTAPQSALGLAERRANVRGAFRARPEAVGGRIVTLVDDVLTTGATAEECARALLDAGARAVRVLTVARAMP